MAVYSLHFRASGPSIEAVPDRFSWFAALLPPVYALTHGLWLMLFGYLVAVAALVGASLWIGEDAATGLYLLLAILIGLEAHSFRRSALRRRGYAYGGARVAESADAAAISWLGATQQAK